MQPGLQRNFSLQLHKIYSLRRQTHFVNLFASEIPVTDLNHAPRGRLFCCFVIIVPCKLLQSGAI